jgi:hypothetical protein
MLPKQGINHVPLAQLYAATIRRDFETVLETRYWVVAQRKAEAVTTDPVRAREGSATP